MDFKPLFVTFKSISLGCQGSKREKKREREGERKGDVIVDNWGPLSNPLLISANLSIYA